MNKLSNWPVDYNKIVALYHEDSDRAAAVLAASFIEKCLEDCIRSFLVDDPATDKLFEAYGPLATFSGKIDVAFALGLISREIKRDLTYIRKIRNHFAHYASETSFDVVPCCDLCANLSMSRPIQKDDGTLYQETKPRMQFLFTIGVNIIWLTQFVERQQKRSVPPQGEFHLS